MLGWIYHDISMGMVYLTYIDCETQAIDDDRSLLVLGSIIVEQNEMRRAREDGDDPQYIVVVAYQVIKVSGNHEDFIDQNLIKEFEPIYERFGRYLEDKGKDASGVMVFSDQGRTNQSLRKRCRELMEGEGQYPITFAMSGGLNVQEKARGLDLAREVTEIAYKGIRCILSNDFDAKEAQEFKKLPFRKYNDWLLGYGIANSSSYRSDIEGLFEKFFDDEWKGKKD